MHTNIVIKQITARYRQSTAKVLEFLRCVRLHVLSLHRTMDTASVDRNLKVFHYWTPESEVCVCVCVL